MTDPQLPPPPGAYPGSSSAPPVPPVSPVPPGAYQVPVGGYATSAGAYTAPATTNRRSALLGTLALVFALVAAIVTPLIAGINALTIGRALPTTTAATYDLRMLSPVRDQVLWTEISFWAGTVLGIAAIVIGIIAIAKRRGRGAGIAAIIVAAFGVIFFFTVLIIALTIGGAAGAVGYS